MSSTTTALEKAALVLVAILASAVPGYSPSATERSLADVSDRPEIDSREGRARIVGKVVVKAPGAGPARPLADAVVYLASDPGFPVRRPTQPVVLNVKGSQIRPRYSCVVVGQTLLIKVDEKTKHVINVSSPKEPNLRPMYPAQASRVEKVFSKVTECVIIDCFLEPKVKGYVTVVPNAVFARTNEDGEFQLPVALPVGKYEVRSYHPDYGRAVSAVEVHAGEKVVPVNLVVER